MTSEWYQAETNEEHLVRTSIASPGDDDIDEYFDAAEGTIEEEGPDQYFDTTEGQEDASPVKHVEEEVPSATMPAQDPTREEEKIMVTVETVGTQTSPVASPSKVPSKPRVDEDKEMGHKESDSKEVLLVKDTTSQEPVSHLQHTVLPVAAMSSKSGVKVPSAAQPLEVTTRQAEDTKTSVKKVKEPTPVTPVGFLKPDVSRDWYKRLEEVKVIGAGSFGRVVLLKDTTTGRRLVDKRVCAIRYKENIRWEVSIMMKLSLSPGRQFFLRPLGLFDDDKSTKDPKCHLLMEYFMGEDLHYIVTRTFLTIWEVQKILRQIGRALYYLHSCNIIHRDVKLDNILVNPNLDCKLIDFNVSAVGTKAEGSCGNRYFSAPEVKAYKDDIDNAKPYGFEVDYYSLGMVAIAMGAGLFHVDLQRKFLGKDKKRYFPWVMALRQLVNPEGPCDEFMDLIIQLLYQDGAKRLNDSNFCDHPFFRKTFRERSFFKIKCLDDEALNQAVEVYKKEEHVPDPIFSKTRQKFEEKIKQNKSATFVGGLYLVSTLVNLREKHKSVSKKESGWKKLRRFFSPKKKSKKMDNIQTDAKAAEQAAEEAINPQKKKKKSNLFLKIFRKTQKKPAASSHSQDGAQQDNRQKKKSPFFGIFKKKSKKETHTQA